MNRFGYFIFLIAILVSRAETAKAFQVECEDRANCSSSVAGLAMTGGSVCTGFLIDKDVLVTNFHCLPEGLKKVGSSCEGQIHFLFPATQDHQAEEADCDKILSLSSSDGDEPLRMDYAVLKLKSRVERPPLYVNDSGIRDGEDLTIYKIDPVPGRGGVLKRVTCPAIQNTIINPYFDGDLAGVVSLVPCSIIKGNSGSPMVDSSGSVKGVISASSELSLPEGVVQDKPNAKLNLASGTSFACIDLPTSAVLKSSLHAECRVKMDSKARKKRVDDMLEASRAKLQQQLNKTMDTVAADLTKAAHGIIHWKVDVIEATSEQNKKGIQSIFQFVPECLNLQKEKLAEVSTKLKDGKVSYDFKLPEVEVIMAYDDHYRIVGKTVRTDKLTTVDVVPTDLLNDEKSKIYLNQTPLPILSCYRRAN